MLLGVLGFASQIPSFLLAPFAGVISDRYNRHWVLLLTQTLSMLQAGVLTVLVMTDTATFPRLLALSAFLGFVNGFDVSARQAFVVELIDKREDVSNAIALNSSLFNAARLIGPSIAGVLICFSFTRSLGLALAFIFLAGLGLIVHTAANNTLLQTIVDDDKRGRVMSFYAMAFMGMAPFGSLLAGTVANRLGVPFTLLACGVLCLLSVIPFALQLPAMRKMVRPIYERLGILPQVATGIQAAAILTTPPEDQ